MRPPTGRAVPTRLRILQALRSRRNGFWTIDEMAAAQGIERTVAFEHLEQLVAADLATKQRVSGARGRPLNAYRYAGVARDDSSRAQRSQLLATLLAQSLAITPGGARLAHGVGREFGKSLRDIGRLGGGYRFDDRSAHALSCMFETTCASARQVVCGLHAGLIEGALASTGATYVVTPEGPDGLGGCVFHMTEGGKG